MLRSSSPGQVLGSYVANRVLVLRLVQRLGWVFETQERKKENIGPHWAERVGRAPPVGVTVGRGFGLVPCYTTLSVRVRANINSVP